jgi:hypothetical protein
LAVLLVCLGFGCDEKEAASPPATSQGTTASTASSTTTSSTPRTIDPNRGFSTETVFVDGPGANAPGTSLFDQVRFAAGEGYDRAVFEFEQSLPYGGFYVEYDADGRDSLGDAGCEAPDRTQGVDLVVSFHGTGTSELPEGKGRQSYTGRERIRPETTKEIVEAVFFYEFEATVEWVLVLRQQRPFRLTTVDDPPRVVLDIQSS